MATARERLIQALSTIVCQPFSEEGKTALNRLLNTYRVQAKPGETTGAEKTARDVLAKNLLEVWKNGPILERSSLNRVIAGFRMQLKQGLSKKKYADKNLKSNHDQQALAGTESYRSRLKENVAKHENAYFKDKAKKDTKTIESKAIAGGPKQTSNTRGQCPKCRSFGIVLARAYGGDDYHSCIYCGYQEYLKNADPNLDLPLAAHLLNALKEPILDDED